MFAQVPLALPLALSLSSFGIICFFSNISDFISANINLDISSLSKSKVFRANMWVVYPHRTGKTELLSRVNPIPGGVFHVRSPGGVGQICPHLLFPYYACDVYENWHGCVPLPSFLIFI